ncbi:hypothetical protein [Methanoculleus chikugoensis]|uniref:MHYT domain-containing protein n=1 Tax=Methanoculleus chikugoensis TaxID=118126 RepID=UPI0006D2A50D|nr:MHYT domain-containing protein [Methanoculleus chikugoensis]
MADVLIVLVLLGIAVAGGWRSRCATGVICVPAGRSPADLLSRISRSRSSSSSSSSPPHSRRWAGRDTPPTPPAGAAERSFRRAHHRDDRGAAWHFIPPWLLQNSPVWAAGQALSTVALRVLIVWLYNNTHKSVFAATLFHGMVNVAGFSFPNFGSHYDPVVTGGAIAVAVAAVVVAVWGGPTTLARRS